VADGEIDGRRPRTLIVSAYAEPHVGGVEVVVAQQARTLVALGHHVTLVTSQCGAGATKFEHVDGFDIVRFPAWNKLEELRGVALPIWSPAAIWPLARLVKDADIVHVHDVYHPASMLAAMHAKRLGRPLFITQHVAIVDHDKAIVKLVQKLIYASAARFLWKWAVTITVYNPIVENFIAGHRVGRGKIRLTYNGIDTTRFRPGDPDSARATKISYGLDPDRPVILFAGRLVPKKGVTKLVGAAGPEYQVVLAGPGSVPADIPAGVTFLGPLDRRDLLRVYQASDIFALPAVSEMLTLAMQEAMACGLPVVTTNDRAYDRYEFDPAGIALVAPEPEVLRSVFLDILGDPARRKRMQEYSRQLAEERFDWQKNAAAQAADYDRARRSGQLVS